MSTTRLQTTLYGRDSTKQAETPCLHCDPSIWWIRLESKGRVFKTQKNNSIGINNDTININSNNNNDNNNINNIMKLTILMSFNENNFSLKIWL